MTIAVRGYELPADRMYDPASHMWVQLRSPGRARIGFDPLGRETSGDVVALSLVPAGTEVVRGGELGNLEAAKFVGPIIAPVSGTVIAHNPEVAGSPGLLNDDPLVHWVAEIAVSDESELALLLGEPDAVAEWFAAAVDRFRAQGAIAE